MEKGINLCTGVVVSPTTILTAHHCINQSTGIQWVTDYFGNTYSAKVIKKDKVYDLALLQVYTPFDRTAKIGDEPLIASKVYSVHSGLALDFTYGEGVVNNVIRYEDTDPVPFILHSILISQGASGSGLFNEKGELVGINDAVIKTGTLAVNTPEIKKFLKN